jgi:hypothetical protein
MADSLRIPSRSLGLKLLLVCGLAALMSIPAIFVGIVLWDRMSQADKATNEISQIVGGQQSVLGPVLIAPYTAPPADPKEPTIRGYYVVYPETGNVKANLAVEARRRSIYQVPVFNADIDFTAQFGKIPDPGTHLAQGATVYWGNARLYMGVSDLRGARSEAVLTLANGETRIFEPAPENGASLNLMAANVADLVAKGAPFDWRARSVSRCCRSRNPPRLPRGQIGLARVSKAGSCRTNRPSPKPASTRNGACRSWPAIRLARTVCSRSASINCSSATWRSSWSRKTRRIALSRDP